MANPTTNYGFVLPTPTDLVTDLPADFEVALQGVDTQMKTNADAAIAKTIVDAKGDLIAATAADTVSRLEVGANNTVLTADSTTATGLKWATPASGGMTLISTTTLTGASITLSSIPQTYKNLVVVLRAYLPNTGNAQIRFRFNGETGSGSHASFETSSGNNNSSNLTWGSSAIITAGQSASTTQALSYVEVYDYTNTSTDKIARFTSIGTDNSDTSKFTVNNGNAFYNSTSAVSSIVLAPSSGNFTSGTCLLYGVN
jgi:hypothetical protein